MKKLFAVFALLLIVAMALPACAPAAPDCKSADVVCVGLVTDVGKIDDKSFNHSAWEGVKQAEKELGAKVQYIETTDFKDYDKNISTFADEGYDVIVTVGFGMGEATAAAAGKYPEVDFVGVDQFQAWQYDDDASNDIANVSGLNFPEDQAGFLVGALAAMMSETGKISALSAVPMLFRPSGGSVKAIALAQPTLIPRLR